MPIGRTQQRAPNPKATQERLGRAELTQARPLKLRRMLAHRAEIQQETQVVDVKVWTDHDVAGFGNLLVEMFAFVGDVLSYYGDNQARESRLVTTRRQKWES